MSAITEFLFPAPAKRSAASIIRWWERRRLPYNLAVGAAGVLSLAFSTILVALPPNGPLLSTVRPWQPILVSVGLALFPALLMVIFWVARIVMAIV